MYLTLCTNVCVKHSCYILMELKIFDRFSKSILILNFIKIISLGVELLQADIRVNTHRQDEANGHISKLCKLA